MKIHPSHHDEARPAAWTLALLGILLFLVWIMPVPADLTGIAQYLPLHTALETLAIVVGGLIFAIGWNMPRAESSRNILLLACTFLGVALLDLAHTLSYFGMPDFVTPSGVEKAINFWVAARVLAALALLAVAILPWGQPISQRQALGLLGAVLILVLGISLLFLYRQDWLPRTFIPGEGLTRFKIATEYLLVAVYLLAAVLFWRHLQRPRTFAASSLLAAAAIMAMGEFCFTLYASVTDIYNLTGHLYKVIAYLFLYRALFVDTVLQPYARLYATRNQLEVTLQALPDLLFEMSRDGRYLAVHASQSGNLLLAPADLIGKNLAEVMPAAAAQTCLAAIEEAERTGFSQGQVIELPMADGPHWFERSVARKPQAWGEEDRFLVISRDITARQRAEAVLRDSEERFRTLFEESRQATLLVEDGRFTAANRAALAMLGIERVERFLGLTPADISPPLQPDGRGSAEKAEELIRLAFAQRANEFEWEHRRANGEPFIARITLTVIRQGDKDLLHVVWNDITEQKRARERIEFLAYKDPLTGLPNRLLGQDRLRQALASAQRRQTCLAVLYLDLDKFKYINDTFGHATGDRLLQSVAQRLSQDLRAEDTLCRLSADEFMLILQGLPEDNFSMHLAEICERVQASIAEPHEVDGLRLFTALSIGIALFPQDGDDPESLMLNAHMALNEAKKVGQNSYRFFEPGMNAALIRFVLTRDALRLALVNREFELHYQPQVNLHSGRVVGVEALIRWRRPGEGLKLPTDFIPEAEESGLIVPIGRWALHEACCQVAAWQAAGWPDLVVGVNLSAVQFRQGQVVADVQAALADSGLNPACLDLELTESLLLQHETSILAIVAGWKVQGIMLSIDDFGTGYSSLAYLKRFKVDKLKIDRSFVINLSRDAEDRAIVQAMIEIARGLKLKTIAEGVEDAALAEQLRLMGCDEVQGYLYAKPLPPAEFKQWLDAFARRGANDQQDWDKLIVDAPEEYRPSTADETSIWSQNRVCHSDGVEVFVTQLRGHGSQKAPR